ncbi:hypothetical protein ACFYZI_18585 [Streptomyces griseorubiginosus]|uniref:hypothetical protein n=1 Tax=Streptomyces griseorubiginosus TaxID=67304 RepID=UPI000AC8E215|nr:hypothetical protein [Streptomyces griseorubiginosus]
MRKALGALAATVAVIASGMVFAPAASAAGYGCAGSEIDTYPVKTSGGTQYATIHLFYDSSTGNNCAVTVATTAGGYGTSETTMASISECSGTTLTSCVDGAITRKADAGSYQYYAGPVSVPGAGHCILVSGSRTHNGVVAGNQYGPVHC